MRLRGGFNDCYRHGSFSKLAQLTENDAVMLSLKRNWKKQVERGSTAKKIGYACLTFQRHVFELWRRYREGSCTRADLEDCTMPLVFELRGILQSGCRSNDTIAS
jgi:hypothetical protein